VAEFKVPDRSALIRWRGTLDGLVSEAHPARFVWETLSRIDFSELEAQYKAVLGGPGRPPYHPRLIAALWIYGMMVRLETATDIADACTTRDDFKWLAGGLCPCDQTLLNFVTRMQAALSAVWVQVLQAMQREGHVDLSVIFEDGTKLHANAAPGSFKTLEDVQSAAAKLEKLVAERVKQLSIEPTRSEVARVASARSRLSRAKQAEEELRRRIERRRDIPKEPSPTMESAPCGLEAPSRPAARYGTKDFRLDSARGVLICPAEKDLGFIGEYATENGRSRYRLYGRSDCGGCPLRERCTTAKGRRVKILTNTSVSIPATNEALPESTAAETPPGGSESGRNKREREDKKKHGPRASLTDPEAVMMLATSEKRWQPSFNADIAVTRDGVIVSQFLTKNPTDFASLRPSLQFVCSTLGRPQSWVGDGHYGTVENIVRTAAENVALYAPRASGTGSESASNGSKGEPEKTEVCEETGKFAPKDFRAHPDRPDVLLCPAGEDLPLLGIYPTANRRGTYRLYGRSDCRGCELKERCTEARGRRVKLPNSVSIELDAVRPETPGDVMQKDGSRHLEQERLLHLLREHDARMEQRGEELRRLRGVSNEPVNAQLKQHGLGRLHIRGLARCAGVLTLASIAHNLSKWRAREAASRLLEPVRPTSPPPLSIADQNSGALVRQPSCSPPRPPGDHHRLERACGPPR
jgi:transposase